MKIKNFTLISSSHNLEIELKNLTKNANKIIFICNDFDGYNKANNSLYKILRDIQYDFKKTFKIIHLNQTDKDEITKEQNLSSIKIYKYMLIKKISTISIKQR